MILDDDDLHVRDYSIIYEYNVRSEAGKALERLYVEIQYRTLVQHAWATAVEVVGLITESQPKFQKGDLRYEHAMALASVIIARAHERRHGPLPDLDDRSVVKKFPARDKELGLLKKFEGTKCSGSGDFGSEKCNIDFRPNRETRSACISGCDRRASRAV